jgi:hypothetical protein
MDAAAVRSTGAAPASTLYHVFGAVTALLEATGRRCD